MSCVKVNIISQRDEGNCNTRRSLYMKTVATRLLCKVYLIPLLFVADNISSDICYTTFEIFFPIYIIFFLSLQPPF